MQSKPIKFTDEEGGTWRDWFPGPKAVHSILFENGWVFDTNIGWRFNAEAVLKKIQSNRTHAWKGQTYR